MSETTSITHARGADFLTHLQEVGAARAKRWHPTPEQEFTGLEWAGAMCGEAGEAANVAKKLRRAELAIAGNAQSERPALPPELVAKLGRELADTLIYAVNVASHYGINLADATVEAFNAKSIEMGFPERITRSGGLNSRAVSAWIEDHSLYSVGSSHVTLPDYDGEPGIVIDGDRLRSDDPLGDAIAHAQKLIREVQSADDVGSEECERQLEEWIKEHGLEAPMRGATPAHHVEETPR